MTERTAEEAAHAYARAVVALDLRATILALTPEAFGKTLLLGNQGEEYDSYELRVASEDGEDHLFDVAYTGKIAKLSVRYRLRTVDGKWKVVDLEKLP